MDRTGIIKRRLIAYPCDGAPKAYVFEVEIKTATTLGHYHVAVDETTFVAHRDGDVFAWDERSDT